MTRSNIPAVATLWMSTAPAPVVPAVGEILWWNVLITIAVVAVSVWVVRAWFTARRTAKLAAAENLRLRARLSENVRMP